MYKFNDIIFDDATIEKDGSWSQICEICTKKNNLVGSGGEYYSLDENCGSGICGIEGCNNESGYYIDFPEGELKEL